MSVLMNIHSVTRIAMVVLCAVGLLFGGVAGAEPDKAKGKAAAAGTKPAKPGKAAKARGEYLLPKAKAAGQVGEQPDGYLGLVDESAPEQIKKMVIDTNERRKARYTEVSKKRGSSVESVEQMAGEKFAKRAKPGELLRAPDGTWTKK